jgi:hypothetical protein
MATPATSAILCPARRGSYFASAGATQIDGHPQSLAWSTRRAYVNSLDAAGLGPGHPHHIGDKDPESRQRADVVGIPEAEVATIGSDKRVAPAVGGRGANPVVRRPPTTGN